MPVRKISCLSYQQMDGYADIFHSTQPACAWQAGHPVGKLVEGSAYPCCFHWTFKKCQNPLISRPSDCLLKVNNVILFIWQSSMKLPLVSTIVQPNAPSTFLLKFVWNKENDDSLNICCFEMEEIKAWQTMEVLFSFCFCSKPCRL